MVKLVGRHADVSMNRWEYTQEHVEVGMADVQAGWQSRVADGWMGCRTDRWTGELADKL